MCGCVTRIRSGLRAASLATSFQSAPAAGLSNSHGSIHTRVPPGDTNSKAAWPIHVSFGRGSAAADDDTARTRARVSATRGFMARDCRQRRPRAAWALLQRARVAARGYADDPHEVAVELALIVEPDGERDVRRCVAPRK